MDKIVVHLASIARKAGAEILKYHRLTRLEVKIKADHSPVTQADLASEKIIIEGLNQIADYPIVSEETYDFDHGKKINGEYYWLVDPLDGTKEFISHNNEFTVNIALMKDSRPYAGLIYVPIQDLCYWAIRNQGAYINDQKIFNNSQRTDLIGVTSRFHHTTKDDDFFKKYNITKFKSYGSSIKYCKLAEGEADVYPRFNGTKEWDTAAGHLIANEAGCKFVDITTKNELLYNKDTIINNHFIAFRNDLDFIQDL